MSENPTTPPSAMPTTTNPGPACAECDDYRVSRRTLIRGALGIGAGMALFGTTFVQTSYAATPVGTIVDPYSTARAGSNSGNILVVLSLRGAADGLSLVVPHGDPTYYKARPGIAIPKSTLLAPDGFFGLHPQLAPLLPMWKAGKVAAVHATGLRVPNRSHFAAMEEVEDADPGSAARIGWLNRLVGLDKSSNPLRGMGIGMSTPLTALYGPTPTVTAETLEKMTLAGAKGNAARTKSMRTMWASASGEIGRGGRAAMSAADAFAPVRNSSENAMGGAQYARDDLGRALAASARTIRANVGVEVIAVDHDGGWDMHAGLGTLEWGAMIRASKSLAQNLAAFFTDLGTLGDRVTVVTISEFGRRVKENANFGLDHGHGNVMFLLGGGVKGGYYGTWTRLSNSVDADVPVTTDYRSVLAEIVTKRLGASAAAVFPGFKPVRVGAIR